MLRAIQPVLYVLLLSIFFISCEKELSEENGLLPGGGNSPGGSSSGTAAFIMEGAPNVCDGYTLSGTYTAGEAVTSTNAVAVNVTVTTIGTYTISTALINGVTFSGSGVFTNLGSQQILLTATGTPTVAGTFNYKPGTDWCSFPVIVAPGISNPVASGTLNCAGATNAGVYMQGIPLTALNTVTIPVDVTNAGTYSINTTATNGVTFSGSGSLALGAQTIVLTGSGLPANPGTVTIPVSLGGNNCNISVDFLPGVPQADGTLDCSTAVISGTYTQGTPLTSANTVTIPVDVTVAGTYSINTGAVNGVTFTGTGALATGTQTIVLTGSGTPTNSGPTTYDISLGTSFCSFVITYAP